MSCSKTEEKYKVRKKTLSPSPTKCGKIHHFIFSRTSSKCHFFQSSFLFSSLKALYSSETYMLAFACTRRVDTMCIREDMDLQMSYAVQSNFFHSRPLSCNLHDTPKRHQTLLESLGFHMTHANHLSQEKQLHAVV